MTSTAQLAQPPVPSEAFEQYPGRWVAIRGDEIVAVADDVEVLRADPKVRGEDALFLVPEPSSHFYSVRPA
jgi:hypothetical protein